MGGAISQSLIGYVECASGNDVLNEQNDELEEASTHKSAKTHTGNVSVTRDLRPFDPKINGFPVLTGLIVEHFYIKFGDPSCIVF